MNTHKSITLLLTILLVTLSTTEAGLFSKMKSMVGIAPIPVQAAASMAGKIGEMGGKAAEKLLEMSGKAPESEQEGAARRLSVFNAFNTFMDKQRQYEGQRCLERTMGQRVGGYSRPFDSSALPYIDAAFQAGHPSNPPQFPAIPHPHYPTNNPPYNIDNSPYPNSNSSYHTSNHPYAFPNPSFYPRNANNPYANAPYRAQHPHSANINAPYPNQNGSVPYGDGPYIDPQSSSNSTLPFQPQISSDEGYPKYESYASLSPHSFDTLDPQTISQLRDQLLSLPSDCLQRALQDFPFLNGLLQNRGSPGYRRPHNPQTQQICSKQSLQLQSIIQQLIDSLTQQCVSGRLSAKHGAKMLMYRKPGVLKRIKQFFTGHDEPVAILGQGNNRNCD